LFDDVDAVIRFPRPSWASVRWIDVEGLHPYVVNRLREALSLHTLAAEDVWHTPQRPKVEVYDDHVFVIVQRFSVSEGALSSEQVSAFTSSDMLLTFQELHTDIWGTLRERLAKPDSRIRKGDASYLLYAVLDTVVDSGFPVLEAYGERLEQLEEAVLEEGAPRLLQEVHAVKRDLAVMRRVLWPLREAISELARPDKALISDASRTYLRDVHDHCIQLMDILETFRELASNLTDLHLSMSSNRMNEVMKVLTVIATIFIPITFLAGVYGMNFQHLPELHWRHGYASFWLACGSVTCALLWYFHRRGWLRR
jgi:magnesium transporter